MGGEVKIVLSFVKKKSYILVIKRGKGELGKDDLGMGTCYQCLT